MRRRLSIPLTKTTELVWITKDGDTKVVLSIQETQGTLKTRTSVEISWLDIKRITSFLMSQAPPNSPGELEPTPISGVPYPEPVKDDPYHEE